MKQVRQAYTRKVGYKVAKKITPQDAADALGVSPQTIRVALQNKLLPFGWAIKTSANRYTYVISPKLFAEYIGQREGGRL